MSKKSSTFASNLENNIINPQIERNKTMARKRHCENKSYLTAKGSSVRFIGAANDSRKGMLMRAFNFPLHVCEVGADIIAYYQEDFHVDDLEFMRENYGKQLGDLVSNKKIKKSMGIVLSKVLPEVLPMQRNRTWQQVYEDSLESTERDESGKGYKTRSLGVNYEKEEDKPQIVRTYSVNEYRTNGHF